MNECPVCHKQFKSLRGMRSHHKYVHGKSLLEISCQTCGKTFLNYEGDRKFCSRGCAGKYFSSIYSQNKTAICTTCGEEFPVRPNQLRQEHNFCSRECSYKWRRRNRKILNCEICGVEFDSAPYDDERRFCSKACEAKWKSLAYKGKTSGRAKKTIVYTCQLCGKLFADTFYVGERKFCSKNCYAESLKNRSPKQCKFCRGTFEVSLWDSNRIYCSWQCFRSDKGETEPERLFREFLEKHQVPFVQEWRIPHSRFHADFYLHEENLIIEIDGEYWHSPPKQQEKDQRKDELCSAMGLGVLRIDAMKLIEHFERGVSNEKRRHRI